jgi:DNA polymerase III subunit epsilon
MTPDVAHPLASAPLNAQFVIVDVETTGWLPEESAIIEIGAVRIGGGLPELEFSALVNPGSLIPADITELTGITDAMVSDAPPIGAVLPGFLAFARGCVLTAHNAPFDIGFLSAACQCSRLAWPAFPVLDTAEVARSVLSEDEVPDCKLATLAGFFGTRTRPCHRALADAKATAEVLQGLLPRMPAAGLPAPAQITT